MAQITQIAATTVTELNKSPYLVANPVHFNSVPGATLYGVNLASRDARGGNYQRWVGDGLTDAWNSDKVVNLVNAHVDGGVLAGADVLRVVVKVDGAVLQRVASGATPGAGEFKTHTVGGKTTITFGAAPAAGGLVEIFLAPAASVNTKTLTANVPSEGPAYQVVYASAAAQAIRLTR